MGRFDLEEIGAHVIAALLACDRLTLKTTMDGWVADMNYEDGRVRGSSTYSIGEALQRALTSVRDEVLDR